MNMKEHAGKFRSLDEALRSKRRLVIVTPRSYVSERPSDLYVGINALIAEYLLALWRADGTASYCRCATLARTAYLWMRRWTAAVPNRFAYCRYKTLAARIRVDVCVFEYNEMEARSGFFTGYPRGRR
ncbi:MAG: hypothetical protein U0528_21120 [Anaerolineae bacterium]